MVNWLAGEERLITITPHTAKDGTLTLSKPAHRAERRAAGRVAAAADRRRRVAVVAQKISVIPVRDDVKTMPELPEVETTLRGIAPHLHDQTISDVVIRNASLRWPIPDNLPQLLRGQTVRPCSAAPNICSSPFDHGTLILHLGMSGSLRILPHTPRRRNTTTSISCWATAS